MADERSGAGAPIDGRWTRREILRASLAGAGGAGLWGLLSAAEADAGGGSPLGGARDGPNIILAMTDDQGWGDVGYNGNKVLKTPTLDEMAAGGIRFNRFYAAAPVCSPTRGSCMTGRHPNRFACFSWGRPIRPQEVTIAQAVKRAGYTTGHFGKWHLNGKSGAGRPILAADPLSPGRCGFDEWLSAHNYFDLNPSLGRNGKPEKFTGEGSDIIVAEALKFIARAAKGKTPFLAVIWFGSPHGPHRALEKDRAPYADQPKRRQHYLGELAAVDRGMGTLRAGLRDLGVADDTMLWFTSDNGCTAAGSTAGLKGHKGSLWEGGLRVPGLLEWPARVKKPFATDVPCCTSDYYPTALDLLGVKVPNQPRPIDGISLMPLIEGKMTERPRPIAFEIRSGRGPQAASRWAALTGNRYKLHKLKPRARRRRKGRKPPAEKARSAPAEQWQVRLFDLVKDPAESKDLSGEKPDLVAEMKAALETWQTSVTNSLAGKDYSS